MVKFVYHRFQKLKEIVKVVKIEKSCKFLNYFVPCRFLKALPVELICSVANSSDGLIFDKRQAKDRCFFFLPKFRPGVSIISKN